MSRDFVKIFVDVETTGLDPNTHEIIEFALIRDGGSTEIKIRPEHIETASETALKVNGYSKKKWEEADNAYPSMEAALHHIKGFMTELGRANVKTYVLVGHNVKFDYAFLENNFKRHNMKQPFSYHTIDTVTLAMEHLVPLGLTKLSLKDVCLFLGIEPESDVHGAMNGARKCKEVHDKIMSLNWFSKWMLKHRKHQ